jgi:hypothetical protein
VGPPPPPWPWASRSPRPRSEKGLKGLPAAAGTIGGRRMAKTLHSCSGAKDDGEASCIRRNNTSVTARAARTLPSPSYTLHYTGVSMSKILLPAQSLPPQPHRGNPAGSLAPARRYTRTEIQNNSTLQRVCPMPIPDPHPPCPGPRQPSHGNRRAAHTSGRVSGLAKPRHGGLLLIPNVAHHVVVQPFEGIHDPPHLLPCSSV